MSMEQETLIYVEENDKSEARVMAQSFAKKDVKSRAYINALGAELGMKYLALESINNSKVYNMHSVHKVLEEFDISDIMLNNIHIDVRVVFDENFIFIPKSHFEYDILPDIYLVLLLSEDHSHASFLGFFEPKLINKNNQNSKYYFIEKEKLTPPANLKAFIGNFKGNTTQALSNSENEKAEILMVSMADQNISSSETKELLSYLKKSADLRDKFIEFENFELLSYKAEHSPDVKPPEISDEVPDTTIEDLTGTAADAEIEDVSDAIEDALPEDMSLDELMENTEAETSDNSEILNTETAETSDILDNLEETAIDLNLNAPDIAALADDVAGGLAAAGLASAAEIGAEAFAAGTIDAAIDAAENVVEKITDAAASEDNSTTAAAAMDETISDIESSDIDGLPLLGEDMLSEGLADADLPELGSEDMSLESFVDVNDTELDASGSELSLQEESTEQAVPSEDAAPVAEEFPVEVKPSVEADSEMADMDQLTAKASAGNFDDASLDDLMAPEEDENSDLSSIEALQEENARKKGLLPSLDDDSLLESSLDFSKVKAVPQVDVNTLSAGIETVDISGFDAIAPEVKLEEVPENDEFGVLDISDVNAQPNNLGDNISETVELNNIGIVDNTCENQKAPQKTAPTAGFGEMGAFGALSMEDTFDVGFVDMDNMSISMDTSPAPAKKRPASPEEVDLTGFQSLDMEDFQMVPLDNGFNDPSIPKVKEEEDLASALLGDMDLDSIAGLPNLDGDTESLISDIPDDDPKDNGHVEGSLGEAPPGEAEMLSFDDNVVAAAPVSTPAPLNSPVQSEALSTQDFSASIDDLSIDDIVDSPDDASADVDLISQAVEMDVAQDTLFEENSSVESDMVQSTDIQSENVPSMSDTPVDNLSSPAEQPVQQPPVGESQSPNSEASQIQNSASGEEDFDTIGTPMDSAFSETDTADLSMLFDENSDGAGVTSAVENGAAADDSFIPTLPHLPERKAGSSKGLVIGAAVLVALLAAGTFFGLSMKNKNDLTDTETLSQPLPENTETQTPEAPAAQENNENIMANAPEVIDMPQNQAEPTNVKPEPAQPKDAKASTAKPVNPEGAIISVKKLSWELPDYLSYSEEMKKYLQTAGKSIKLTLTSDLLLASEYAYSNQVKVALKLSNDGNIQDAKVVKSSGSTEIDDIVLQTVKETLNVVKPAPGEVPTPDFNLGLIINF